jgi:hypothetical protein
MSDAGPVVVLVGLASIFATMSWLALTRPRQLLLRHLSRQAETPSLARLNPFRHERFHPIAILSIRVSGLIAAVGALIAVYLLLVRIWARLG